MLLTSSSFTGEDYADRLRTELLSLTLRVAIDIGDMSVLDVALAHGADVNREFCDRLAPLSKAASSDGTGTVVTHLLQAGAFTVGAGVSIHRTAEYGHHRAIPILLEHGMNPRWVDRGNATALHRAAENGYYRVIEALLHSTSIDIDAVNEEGETPLSLAVRENLYELYDKHDKAAYEPEFHPTVIRMLLKHGANPEIESDGCSLLAWAVSMNQLSIMRTLLDYGARMSTCDNHDLQWALILEGCR